jgi:hypothetical protein
MDFTDDELAAIDQLPPLHNYLAPFSINDISKPLSLYEQEKLANTLLSKIYQSKKKEDDKYRLPAHLAEVCKVFDPPSKLQNVTLPSVSLVSPRTKARLKQLPRLNDVELHEVREIEKGVRAVGTKRVYEDISAAHPVTSAIDVSAPAYILPPSLLSSSPSLRREKSMALVRSPSTSSLPTATTDKNTDDSTAVANNAISSLNNLLVPKFVNTSKVAVFHSNQYFDKIESEKRRLAIQRELIQRLFYATHSPHHQHNRQLTVDNHHNIRTQSAESKESSTTSLFQSKTLTSFFSHSLNHDRTSTKSKKKTKLLSPLTPSGTIPSSSGAMGTGPAVTADKPPEVPQHANPLFPAGPQSVQHEQQQVLFLNSFSARVKDEIGVDLNAKYNRHRQFQHNLEVLGCQWYKCVMFSSVSKWKEAVAYLQHKQRTKAITMIVNLFHRGIYWKRKKEAQRLLLLQRDAERKRFLGKYSLPFSFFLYELV